MSFAWPLTRTRGSGRPRARSLISTVLSSALVFAAGSAARAAEPDAETAVTLASRRPRPRRARSPTTSDRATASSCPRPQ